MYIIGGVLVLMVAEYMFKNRYKKGFKVVPYKVGSLEKSCVFEMKGNEK